MTDRVIEVLLAEDDPDDAELTLRALKEFNSSNCVELVTDGAEALNFLFSKGTYATREQTNPKLALLDLKLPRVNGLELLREIKSTPRTRDIPVVMLTSSSEPSDLKEAYRLGVNSFIVKPVDFTKFIETVHQIGRYWLALNRRPEP
jgi:CheY-like chemotaxis protein